MPTFASSFGLNWFFGWLHFALLYNLDFCCIFLFLLRFNYIWTLYLLFGRGGEEVRMEKHSSSGSWRICDRQPPIFGQNQAKIRDRPNEQSNKISCCIYHKMTMRKVKEQQKREPTAEYLLLHFVQEIQNSWTNSWLDCHLVCGKSAEIDKRTDVNIVKEEKDKRGE